MLHLGSLFTALASFLEARSHQGRWLLRIDDLDTPRNIQGASDTILQTLEAFGLHWDGQVAYQSQNHPDYQQALEKLLQQRLLYRCTCSRKSLSDLRQANPEFESIYPNICRTQNHAPSHNYALRIKTEPQCITFKDDLQGIISEELASQHGDFILQRKDHIIAYQFAVVIDDHLQGVTDVVRGADILDSTIKQIYLHQCLNLAIPNYLHVPVLTGAQGAKLSKSEFAPAVSQHNSRQILFKLLELLRQNPPPELSLAPVATQLDWAVRHWDPSTLSQIRSIDITNDIP